MCELSLNFLLQKQGKLYKKFKNLIKF